MSSQLATIAVADRHSTRALEDIYHRSDGCEQGTHAA